MKNTTRKVIGRALVTKDVIYCTDSKFRSDMKQLYADMPSKVRIVNTITPSETGYHITDKKLKTQKKLIRVSETDVIGYHPNLTALFIEV